MSEIKEAFNINFQTLFINIFLIMACIKYGYTLIEWLLEKLGLEFKSKKDKEDVKNKIKQTEEKIDATNEVIATMQNEQAESIARFEDRDNEITTRTDNIENLINEMAKMTTEIKASVDEIKDGTKLNSSAIVELLYQTINEKCDHYIELGGIPNEEYAVLSNLFQIYHSEGGNHGLKRKVEYCLNKLPIIPDKQL